MKKLGGVRVLLDNDSHTGALTLEVKGSIETEYPVGFAITLQ
jgi:hypothetical protein